MFSVFFTAVLRVFALVLMASTAAPGSAKLYFPLLRCQSGLTLYCQGTLVVTRAVSSEQTSGAVATVKRCGVVEQAMGEPVTEDPASLSTSLSTGGNGKGWGEKFLVCGLSQIAPSGVCMVLVSSSQRGGPVVDWSLFLC